MSTEQNRKIVEDAIALWTAGDGGAIFRILADDVQWTVIGTTAVSGTYNGQQDFIDRALKPLSRRLDGAITPEVVDIIAEGDRIVLLWNGTGRMTDGSPYHNQYSWVMRFKDGAVTEGTAYLDTALLDRLMAIPTA
ncbi:MAG: nuclear transport factor 2 family protein [Rhodospirillaceae bacterium]|nr:nuclear transport factor 2 family protein [Rhodospirillaceae bacterium]